MKLNVFTDRHMCVASSIFSCIMQHCDVDPTSIYWHSIAIVWPDRAYCLLGEIKLQRYEPCRNLQTNPRIYQTECFPNVSSVRQGL